MVRLRLNQYISYLDHSSNSLTDRGDWGLLHLKGYDVGAYNFPSQIISQHTFSWFGNEDFGHQVRAIPFEKLVGGVWRRLFGPPCGDFFVFLWVPAVISGKTQTTPGQFPKGKSDHPLPYNLIFLQWFFPLNWGVFLQNGDVWKKLTTMQ